MTLEACEAGQKIRLDGDHRAIKSVFPGEYILIEEFEGRKMTAMRLNEEHIRRLAEGVGFEVTER